MHDYYVVEKILEMYKDKNYRVTISKRKPRLTQIEINEKIDEETRKKLIKQIYGGFKNV